MTEQIDLRATDLKLVVSAESICGDVRIYCNEMLYNCPRQSCVAALVKRHPYIDDLHDFLGPDEDFLKDVSELNFFALLIAVDSPALPDTFEFSVLCSFLDLFDGPHISRLDLMTVETVSM